MNDLKRDNLCSWCEKTNDLDIMVQGGLIHTVCSNCGSNGPILRSMDIRNAIIKLKSELTAMQAENERLKDELSAIAEVHKQVMEERCPSDEKHCTCVPVLRREIEQLKTDKLIWLTEKEQMTDNFQKCKQAAEYWKGQAEQLKSDKRELVEAGENYRPVRSRIR